MAKKTIDPIRRVPKRVSDLKLSTGRRTPRQIADAALKRLAPTLKIDPQLKDLKYEKVRDTVLGKHVTYQQYHAGKPISGAWIRVDIDQEGKVFNVTNDAVPTPVMAKAKTRRDRGIEPRRPSLTERQA